MQVYKDKKAKSISGGLGISDVRWQQLSLLLDEAEKNCDDDHTVIAHIQEVIDKGKLTDMQEVILVAYFIGVKSGSMMEQERFDHLLTDLMRGGKKRID